MSALYIYNIVFLRGDKTFLANCTDLTKEANVVINTVHSEEDEILKWIKNTKVVQYNITSFDNIKLFANAFLQDNYSSKWAVVVHGYGGSNEDMDYAAKIFFEKGFNVITPDCRGHGRSEGKYIGMGWNDRLDIIKWCDKIIDLDKNCEIVLYGVSMGGATVLMAGGEESIPYNVKCIVEDCGYTSAKDIFLYQIKNTFNFPFFPFLGVVSGICKLKSGFFLGEASTLNQVKKCHIPVLFFHGGKDKLVPNYMMKKLFSNTNSIKQKYIIKEAGHGISAMIDKRFYWEKTFEFINKFIKC